MGRKDIIVISVLVNAGLLVILLISALTTKESYFIASSAKVAGTILEKNENGMIVDNKNDVFIEKKLRQEKTANVQEENSFVKLEEKDENIVHKLPQIAMSEKKTKSIVHNKPKENRFVEIKVRKGDNLEKLAKGYYTSVSEIIRINDLPSSFLRIGQTLLVPKTDKISNVAARNRNSKNAAIKRGEYYTVRAGDNPWTIAMKHHLKVEQLLKLNNLNNQTAKKLRPGDKLRIR